ncbi:MAG: hypothetical protein WDA71_04595 [Actinomycetota bacterium]
MTTASTSGRFLRGVPPPSLGLGMLAAGDIGQELAEGLPKDKNRALGVVG